MEDSNPLLTLLQECVVRIDADGVFLGTGFFVAPGEVLTCAHVVPGRDVVEVSRGGWRSEAEVRERVPSAGAAEGAGNFYPPPDLALLKVHDPAPEQPCAVLETATPVAGTNNDVLYVYGFTEGEFEAKAVHPSAATPDYRGPLAVGGDAHLKLGGDQVLRGYSGAPALNLRTRRVCAVIDGTRDSSSDLGGFGIPISIVDTALPGLVERNAALDSDTWAKATEREDVAAAERTEADELPLRPVPTDLEWDPDEPPSELLKPHHRVVRLIGRESLQEQLMRWREADPRFRVALITGGGGFGKTRLALEECDRASKAGWRSGLLTIGPGEDQGEAVRALAQWPGRLFIAIDYAETRPAAVRSLILRLSARRGGPPVRLVLVCRQGQEKRELGELFATGDGREEVLRALRLADPVRLDELPLARRRLFEEGMATFRERLQLEPVTVPRPGLDADHFSRALFVLAAALLVAQDPGVDADELGQPELMLELLEHESQYWARSNERLGTELDAEIQRSAVAVAAVLGAETEQEALALAGAVPGFEGDLRSLARWLSQLYGDGRLDTPPAIAPMEPDMLAEALVADVYAGRPDLLDVTIDAATDGQLVRALAVFGRAVTGSTALRDQLRRVLDLRLPELLSRAEGNPDLAAALDVTISLTRPLDGALAAVSRVERVTPGLENLVANLHLLGIERIRSLVEEGVENAEALLAQSLSRLGIDFGEMGRHEEAAAADREAVKIRRELAEKEPERYLPELAISLTNLSVDLGELGSHTEALALSQEAVELRRELAEKEPEQYLPDLAMSLSNLAAAFGELGRQREGLPFAKEAVERRRELVKDNPERYLPDLAISLTNLSVDLGALGHHKEALAAVEEAVGLRRDLVEKDPKRHLPDLALSLSNLAVRLAQMGDLKQALAIDEAAVALRRDLVKEDPARHLPSLALSLSNFAVRLTAFGNHDEALEVDEEAVEVRRKLARENPARYLADLALSLNNLSVDLAELARHKEALAVVEEAVDARRVLADENPGRYLPDLAVSLNNLAASLGELGRHGEALPVAEEGVNVRRELARENPARYLPDLALSLNNLAVGLGALGRHEEALPFTEEAVNVRRELARENPARYLPDLSVSLNNLAAGLGELDRAQEAMPFVEEAVEVRRELARESPARYLPDLAISLNNLGVGLGELDQREKALPLIEEAVELRRELARESPERHLPDLAISVNLLAGTLGELDRDEEALAATKSVAAEFEEAPLAGLLQLAVGSCQQRHGEFAAAVASGREALVSLQGTDDAGYIASARRFLRAACAEDQEAFESTWAEQTDEQLPDWLRTPQSDPELLELVREWIATPNWKEDQAFLEAHAEQLLTDAAAVAVEHLADAYPSINAEALTHLSILRSARANGIGSTFSEIFASIASRQRRTRLEEWLEQEGKDAIEFLVEHDGELLNEESEQDLLKLALEHPDDAALFARVAVIGVASGEGDPKAALAFLEAPPESLEDDFWVRRPDLQTLNLARFRVGAEAGSSEASFHHALAAAAAGHGEEAKVALDRCRRLTASWDLPEYRRRLDALTDGNGDLAPLLAPLGEALAESPLAD